MKRVIFNMDPGMGVKYRDIDDGLALLYLIASPGISVEGITINFGNTPTKQGYQVARTLLKITQTNIPVFMGAQSKADLGKFNPAVEYLIRMGIENPGEISLLTTAPLTNIATAMMYEEEFLVNLANLTIMGGALAFHPFSFFGEFNFHLDAKAAALVCAAPVHKTLITMDACSHIVFQQHHLDKLTQNQTMVSKYLMKIVPHWLELNKKVFWRAKGFFPWDVVTALYLTDGVLFDKNPCTLSIREAGIRSGSIQKITYWDNFKSTHGQVPINIPLQLNRSLAIEKIITILCDISCEDI